MKSIFFTTIMLCALGADAQLRMANMKQKDTLAQMQTPIKMTNKPTQVSNMMIKGVVEPTYAIGQYPGSTPLTVAPSDPVKNNVRLFTNVAPNAVSEDANPKYVFLDILKEGRDRLLKFTSSNVNSQIRIERDQTGTVKQTGSYMINRDLKYTDELLTGNFSEEWGASVIVVDRRSNQFWRYRHDATGPASFNNAYSMLSNWMTDQHFAGDFNGDGKTDLLGWNTSRNEFSVALYAKSSTPGMPPIFTPAGVWLSGWGQTSDVTILTGDFNGDARDDIALVHQPTGEWRVALSTGTAFQTSTGHKDGIWLKPWAVGQHHKIAAIDVNNDRICDLVEYDYNTRSFQAVLSNGQYFDYSFKRENIGAALSDIKQPVAIGKFEGNCIIVVSHVLPPDSYYLNPRPTASIYLTSYRR